MGVLICHSNVVVVGLNTKWLKYKSSRGWASIWPLTEHSARQGRGCWIEKRRLNSLEVFLPNHIERYTLLKPWLRRSLLLTLIVCVCSSSVCVIYGRHRGFALAFIFCFAALHSKSINYELSWSTFCLHINDILQRVPVNLLWTMTEQEVLWVFFCLIQSDVKTLKI